MHDTTAHGLGVEAPQSDAETRSALGTSFDPSGGVSGLKGGGAAGPPGEARPGRSDPSSFLMYELKSSVPCQDRTYDEISEGDSNHSLDKFPARLERFGRAKDRALGMAGWMAETVGTEEEELELEKRSAKLRQCGDYLVFRQYWDVQQIRLHAAHFCQQDRLCPLCASRRGAKLLRRHAERALAVMAERPGLLPYMVTSTVRDGPDLGERFGHLTKSMGTLMTQRRQSNAGYRRGNEACKAVGVVHSIEVKRGTGSGEWHPHAHAVWLCEVPPDQGKLREQWRAITGDSHMVDVRPFNFVRAGLPATLDNVAGDFSEVFKYALKFSDMTFADTWAAHSVLRGRRLVASYGALFGVEVPADLLDAPLDVTDLPFFDLMFRFSLATHRYYRV